MVRHFSILKILWWNILHLLVLFYVTDAMDDLFPCALCWLCFEAVCSHAWWRVSLWFIKQFCFDRLWWGARWRFWGNKRKQFWWKVRSFHYQLFVLIHCLWFYLWSKVTINMMNIKTLVWVQWFQQSWLKHGLGSFSLTWN